VSIRKDASGRRSIQVEVQVPGTPEEVWDAIASGPGISSWFVPARLEHGEDGTPRRMILDFGPGMESQSAITAWDPPRRFAAESHDLGPDAPPVATEWIVEARDGGSCTVRVVHSLFSETDDWDDQLHAWESGWPGFFRVLRQVLEHFRGRFAEVVQVMSVAVSGDDAAAWREVSGALGLDGEVGVDADGTSSGDAPPFRGTVVDVISPQELLLRIDRPGDGLAHLFAMKMGGQAMVYARFFFFGDDAVATARDTDARWKAWLDGRIGGGTGDAAQDPA
jgi:uncharacterized protein YndB with AHSA1/START domain